VKRFVLFALMTISLGVSHGVLLLKSEGIAMKFAKPYAGMSDEVARIGLANECYRNKSEYWHIDSCDHYRPSDQTIALFQAADYRRYISKYVDPNKERLETCVNVFMSISYVILAFLAIRVVCRWVRTNGALIGSRAAGMIETLLGRVFRKIGFRDFLSNRELKLAEKEVSRLKILFENKLITNEEFEAGKFVIRERIRNNNLVKISS